MNSINPNTSASQFPEPPETMQELNVTNFIHFIIKLATDTRIPGASPPESPNNTASITSSSQKKVASNTTKHIQTLTTRNFFTHLPQ